MAGRKRGGGTPIYKVYDADGNYQAACRDTYLSAACIVVLGTGATIRYDHSVVVWTEGAEAIEAGESFDTVAEVVAGRVLDYRVKTHRRYCVGCAKGEPCTINDGLAEALAKAGRTS